MRVAVLWTHLSGYLNACLKELAAIEGVQLFVANKRSSSQAPFEDVQFSWIENHFQWDDQVPRDVLHMRLEEFRPDLILSTGWKISGYRFVLKKFKGRSVRIVATDQPWHAGWKQWIGVLVSSIYIHPICDAIFVAGERQVVYARRLGFSQSRILQGIYSCDHEKFAATHVARQERQSDARSFAFVGRLSPEKGLDVLLAAYQMYRLEVSDPWHLKCYGTGPLLSLFDGIEGVELKGFCQPDELSAEFLDSSCLVLPSTYEPWGVVVHEATAAGMTVIASDAVGASVHLVRDGYNGYIVETGNVEELARTMLKFSVMSEAERRIMGENSYCMSLQFTPKLWSSYLVSKANQLTGKSLNITTQME